MRAERHIKNLNIYTNFIVESKFLKSLSWWNTIFWEYENTGTKLRISFHAALFFP